ncbi:bifunctional hydroxymethylpyrimidine kinase/phosphomethylpyrimidine kinase [Lactobacillus jensenii]|jgi:phosphomethylpyrimidine kinase|uniref:Hydroxymethylpyrimidine/phosphomethylpyrimidine kinase n=1 Tax=Lactobacillus jensenii TaxID=109790 RepID=A0A5N1IE20_LACJE|nr:bifunctional hydroxymethylpyrimidine kinase/phosphomethylpyrimidine kinase [Lactobacillus jensenii]EEQ68310.1 phosphomethylpyrimidine kinase [Lactobacillus jensenii 1153]MCT7680621.1 bifunctional hydroxymethylpyrimidine kinase/phosphomethylpyrimidine kinase [Lactobacillus crispatus]APT14088.1 bifunctional hydroxymethylpyrimidine kinase/phosphomethylpyrimidine kinase [Lactobacillus jensenii]EEQ24249.1 phosphomethylpyrimidine kinase [Lactobacillus jensenii 269-3]EEX26973.1 phosphomethylpyrimi
MSKKEIIALTIAGNDSDGSAGMPADLHAFYARKVYGMGLMTAAVAGNTTGIYAAQIMPVDFIQKQFDVLNDDFSIKALKTGMLANKEIINCVADNIEKYDMGKVVIDPVIITKHGNSLLDDDAYQTFLNRLLPLADIITPNYYEQKKLTELPLDSEAEILVGAKKLQDLGAKNVLMKGKHTGDSSEVVDILLTEDGQVHKFTKPYYETERVNGTGDTLSAVITAELAKGTNLIDAVKIAKDFTYEAISHPIIVGSKWGPINHWAAEDKLN